MELLSVVKILCDKTLFDSKLEIFRAVQTENISYQDIITDILKFGPSRGLSRLRYIYFESIGLISWAISTKGSSAVMQERFKDQIVAMLKSPLYNWITPLLLTLAVIFMALASQDSLKPDFPEVCDSPKGGGSTGASPKSEAVDLAMKEMIQSDSMRKFAAEKVTIV